MLKIYLYYSTGNDQPREPALCQLYRRTFIPYWLSNCTFSEAHKLRSLSHYGRQVVGYEYALNLVWRRHLARLRYAGHTPKSRIIDR